MAAQDDDPLISIITVNYNGKKFLADLFSSIFEINYPSSKLQVIMVDNNSIDSSIQFVKKYFPRVEIIPLSKNRGYAGGNNIGFKAARGKYIAAINNDCMVDKNWLTGMLSIFRQASVDSKIGAVGPKVLFFYPYIPIQLISNTENDSKTSGIKNSRRLGIKVSEAKIKNKGDGKNRMLEESIKYLDGFYPPEIDNKNGKLYHWSQGNSIVAVPIANFDEDLEIEFKISSFMAPNQLKVVIGEEIINEETVSKRTKKFSLQISRDLFIYKKDIINSCGAKVNRNFYSRDRGFLSFDEGQYGRVEEVFALSGSSFLVERKMLENIGYFDENFFTYYEDIDLFWRARLKGWKHFYTPNSVVRHHHCGTGGEWSYSFTYHVLRNRMLMLFKNGWPLLFLKNYLTFVISKTINTAYYLVSKIRGNKIKRIDIPIRFKIFFELFYWLPAYLPQRWKLRTGKTVHDKMIKSWVRDF